VWPAKEIVYHHVFKIQRLNVIRVGLISDTHGLLRPEAKAFLCGCNHIVHGGDISVPSILEELARLAPLTAVRGNNDFGAWADRLHKTEVVKIGAIAIYAIHELAQLDGDGLRAIAIQHSVSGVWDN
jgi:predicted phosphodiesterase